MSMAKRDWRAFDYKSWAIVVSPSAAETADDCIRKWWLLKSIRLPQPLRAATEICDVFHECAERWLEADDTGRMPDGTPCDPFPEGWDDRLSFGQSAVVRAVHAAMIDEGVLRRTPGRQIEKSFQIEVLDGQQASMMGFADVWTPLGIEDHKTSKSKRWLETREGLKTNLQMMAYAAAWVDDMLARGEELPASIELRHNQGVVDPDDLYVRPTSTHVTISEIATFWNEKIVPLVRQMLYWKKSETPANSWSKVPGPKKKGICRKYGGCPFEDVCGRIESIDDYKKRVALHNQQFEAATAQETAMSEDLLAKLAARKKARSAAGVTGTPAPAATPAAEDNTTEPVAPVTAPATTPAPAAAAQPAAATPPVRATAPWANSDCKACSGSGINPEGDVCRPCTVLSEAMGILASDFTLEAGTGVINVKRGAIVVASVPFTVPVVAADNTAPTPAESKATPPAPAASEEKTKVRSKRAFTMVYGVVKRGPGSPIDLMQVMQEKGALLATEWNAGSYYAIDVFKRREALAHKAAEIAEEFGTKTVMVTSDQRDLVDFASALEPFASIVIVGGI